MRLARFLLAVGLTLGAARAAAADDISAFVGRTVDSVAVTQSGREAPSEVRSLIAVSAGSPLSLEAIRTSVQSLVTVGRFQSVEVSATATGAGRVALTFIVVPFRPVDDVVFTGDTGVAAADLHHLVVEQFGAIPTSIRPETMQQTVTTLLQDEGFLSATVSAVVADSANPDRAVIAVDVKAGARAVIRRITITGTSPLSPAIVTAETGTAEGMPYRRRAIDDALVKLRGSLRSEQYYQAEAFVESDPVSADGRSVDLTLHVDAGPKVFGPFFTGDPRPAGKIDDLVPMAVEHSADEDLLDDAKAGLETLLRRDGYRDAKATYTRTLTDQGLVVTFAISRGPLSRVGAVSITGDAGVPRDVVTRLFGVAEGEPYSDEKAGAGVKALTAEYAKRGYFKAHVASSRTDAGPAVGNTVSVNVSLAITEGPQADVAEIVFRPERPRVPVTELRGLMRSKPGEPYVATTVALDRRAVETRYRDRGFPSAQVTITPTPDDGEHAMTLTVAIDEGPQIFVQDIRVIGNHRVDTPAILDAMTLKAGGPLGAAAEQQSRQDVQATFGFRTVSIADAPVLNDDSRRHVIVTVEEAPATTIAWGGGLLVDRRQVVDALGGSTQSLDFGPRGSFEISRQNLGGRNRALDFFTRLGVRSNPNVPGNPFGFVEYLVQTRYDEHRAFQTPLDLSFSASSERDVQTDFNFVKEVLKTDALYRASRHVTITGQYALEFTSTTLSDRFNTIPEDQQLQIDRVFPQVRLSILSGGVLWDRRNDPISPSDGTLTSADVEVAPKAIGSQVGFVKTLLQASAYRAIDADRRFIGAVRAEIGLAHGFDEETFLDVNSHPILDPNTGLPILVAALPASERFYAGGGSSVRGFNQDVLGVPLIITDGGFSLGGNGLVVVNLELRTRLMRLFSRDLGLVTFADGGNVFLNASDIRLGQLRGTVGLGARYNSPLGPIRVDFGFKLSRRRFGNGELEPGWTWHLSVGEAF